MGFALKQSVREEKWQVKHMIVIKTEDDIKTIFCVFALKCL